MPINSIGEPVHSFSKMTKFSTIPEWVNWIAQDANGAWWGYEQEPLRQSTGWYENEIGRYIRLGQDKANPDWQNTLRKVA